MKRYQPLFWIFTVVLVASMYGCDSVDPAATSDGFDDNLSDRVGKTTLSVDPVATASALRRTGWAVRTITHLTMSPDFTSLPGRDFFTEQTMMSPREAVRRVYPPRRVEPPNTLMHPTIWAPVLSATSNRVSCWITYAALFTCSVRSQQTCCV